MTDVAKPTQALLPEIQSGRFVLRPLRMSDQGLIAHYSADARVAKQTTSIPHPLPPGATEAYVARVTAAGSSEHVWAMDASGTGLSELVGLISLTQMDRNQSEISYWVAPVTWNTGIASEAVMAMVTANPLGNDTLFASVFQDNPASGRVLTNAGFSYIGDAEAFSVARNGPVNTWTYHRNMRTA
jgi:RimJ/RimL family protein N-acetyltransferase